MSVWLRSLIIDDREYILDILLIEAQPYCFDLVELISCQKPLSCGALTQRKRRILWYKTLNSNCEAQTESKNLEKSGRLIDGGYNV